MGISMCLADLASAAKLQGILERAARLWGAAEALREAMGGSLRPFGLTNYEHTVLGARAQLDQAMWEASWQTGRSMTITQAIDLARL